MKKILILVIVFLDLAFITGTAFAATGGNISSPVILDVPDKFTAVGMHYNDEILPNHRLQNLMKFDFINRKEIDKKFIITDNKSLLGPSKHSVEFYLTYDKEALKNNDEYFISGTFYYYQEYSGTVKEYMGNVTGRLVSTVDQSGLTYNGSKNTILLKLTDTDNSWGWDIYLETAGGSWAGSGDSGGPLQLPMSSDQADVAVGVGISTLGVVLLNTLTKTSVSCAISFNLPASAVTGPVPVQTAGPYTAGGSGGFFEAIKRIFGSIVTDIRDMLVDEGRSYISGKTFDKISKEENKAKE
jgi:hypothetical protein